MSTKTPERYKFYFVGVNNYKLFYIAARTDAQAKEIVREIIPWYQRWRTIRAKEDVDPQPLSERGYMVKIAMADNLQDENILQ